MINKHHYKKIFVGLAALFILFAPVGMTMGGGMGTSSHVILNTMPTTGSGIAENISTTRSPYSTFRLTFNLDLAEATSGGPAAGSPPTTGAGAGANAAPQIPNFFSCASSAVTCSVYYVALIVNGAMGVLVSVGAFLVRLGLQFNDNIYNSPAVTTGFSVALAIANLGFVLGIIIIAIATIIRNQTYGIKQLLWKLVFMAILVNFGLVITAPIVGFADGMSNYFINATSPGSMSVAGYEGYAQTMTAAFAPQDLQLGGAQSTNTTNTTPTSTPGLSTGAAAGVTVGCGIGDFFSGLPGFGWFCNKVTTLAVTTATSPSDNFWQMCMAMIFDIVFSSLIVFTFFCLAILLIIRYLMLGGLLIVLPLAWLTYIFPKFDNSFSKWWNTFIKWVFFPPLALFFIYLAFITATNTTGASGATSGGANAYVAATAGLPLPANGQNGTVELALYTQTGLSGVVQQAADEVLLVGLTIMGLMFALSLSGKAGSTVVNGATHASKAVAGYVGKRTARAAGNAASRAASRAVPQKLKENLQAGKYRFVPKRLQVAAGVGLGNFERTGRANLVEAEAKNAESLAKDPK
ncbi:MAG TPA: hypothetical protein VMS08_00475, partial [Candidatus Saccharimonadia bacterium]|nr:hypothetical protein [Candidatus Saccharimonadia bacterium]